jgi:hypothetical protein
MMRPMRPVDAIRVAQYRHRPDGARLLTDARVRRPVYETLPGEVEDSLLEAANEENLLKPANEIVWAFGLPIRFRNLKSEPRCACLQQPTSCHKLPPDLVHDI